MLCCSLAHMYTNVTASVVKVVRVFVLSTLQVRARSCSSAYRLGLC